MTVSPELKATLDPGTPTVGQPFRVTQYENVPGVNIVLIHSCTAKVGSTDVPMALISQDSDKAVFEGTSPVAGDLVVTCNLHRKWDNSDAPTVTLKATIPAPPKPKPSWGVSMSNNKHPETDGVNFTSVHGYNLDEDVDQAVAFQPLKAMYTDDVTFTTGSRLDVARLKSRLQAAMAKLPTVDEWIQSWGNEVDRHVSASAVALFESNFVTFAQMCESLGVVPSVSFTGNCFRLPLSGTKKFQPFEGFAQRQLSGPDRVLWANLYPPGRDDSPHPTASDPASYIDPVLEWCARIGIKRFGSAERGTPLSTLYSRPEYMQEARDYTTKKCAELGMEHVADLYWDQNIGIDNRLSTDWPKTALAWTS
jgi:hypothetical protein